jgi:hypothetical protein
LRAEYLQNLRYKLQKRVRRLHQADCEQFQVALRHFWAYFDGSPLFQAIAADLVSRCPEAEAAAASIFEGTYMVGCDEREQAAIGYRVLRRYVDEERAENALLHCVPTYAGDLQKVLDLFRSLFLDPVYEYVDEQLDDPRFVLGTLIRFKHLCEWFWRDDLFQTWSTDTQMGEKKLALKLYEFLYQQGIDFSIEPTSVSGEADLVASQLSDEPLVADAKIFNPEKSKGARYIAQGFRQIYQYTSDYNEPVGYLIIFNTSDKQLRFALSAAAEPLPRVVVNNKTIFFVVIDLFPHETSASKRPQSEIVELSEQQIIGEAIGVELPIESQQTLT